MLTKTFRLALVTCLLASVGLVGEPAAAQEPKKVLLFTHVLAARHASLPTVEEVVVELGKRSGDFEVTALGGYNHETEDVDLSFFSADYLRPYDAVMFMTSGELPFDDSQKQALLDFVREGKAFIGVHSAAATNYTWPEYGEMLGGYYQIAGANNRVQMLTVEDTEHPATKFLGDSWPLAAEFYSIGRGVWGPSRPEENRNSFGTPITWALTRDRVHVLLSFDTERSDLSSERGKVRGGDYPIAWCQEYGEGKVFYTALGHRQGLWRNLVFQEHILGGIRWALGLEPGDATPSGERR